MISAIIVTGNYIPKVNSINKKYQRQILSYAEIFARTFIFSYSITCCQYINNFSVFWRNILHFIRHSKSHSKVSSIL